MTDRGSSSTPDSYAILGEVSRGAEGIVYRAQQPITERIVALKVRHGGEGESSEARRRFEHELEAIQRLDHPNLVTLLGVTRHAGAPALVMEWVDGTPIDVWAAGLGSGREALRIRIRMLLQVCAAVSHAHQRGVLHRDLKPRNILLDAAGVPRVVDFGVAKILSERPGKGTQTVAVLGTPRYIAPEVLREGVPASDVRADVYSLGVVLYIVLTGRGPYPAAEDVVDVAHAIETAKPAKASSLNPEIDADLDAILQQAVAVDPEQRYPSADTLADDLRRYLAGQPVEAHPPSSWYRLRKFVVRHPAVSTLSFLAIVLTLAFAATAMWQAQRLEAASTTAERLAQEASDLADRVGATVARFDLTAQGERLRQAGGKVQSLLVGDRIDTLVDWLKKYGDPLEAALPKARVELARLRQRATPWSGAQERRDRENHPAIGELEVIQSWPPKMRRARSHTRNPGANYPDAVIAWVERRVESLRKAIGRRRTWHFPSNRDQYLHDALRSVIEGLERFVGKRGRLALIRDELDWRRKVRALSIDAHADAWQHAIVDIADRPEYRGLHLKPQLGLVPIGVNQESGLWEFAHLRSGAVGDPIPARSEKSRLKIVEGTGIVFVLLPGGRFHMGAQNKDPDAPNFDRQATTTQPLPSESPVHVIRLDPFFIGKYEVTQSQWRRLSFGDLPSRLAPAPLSPDKVAPGWTHPVESVLRSRSMSILARHGLKLPTEARWEYACRAGTSTPWSTGAAPESLAGHANVCDRDFRKAYPSGRGSASFADEFVLTAPVGSFLPNPFGLHDMHGNVEEWTADSPGFYDSRARDGDGDRTPQTVGRLAQVVVRGGAFNSVPARVRSSNRTVIDVLETRAWRGLRAVREIDR